MDNLSFNYTCPCPDGDRSVGGYKNNGVGMTLNPNFSHAASTKWSTLHKADRNGFTPNSAKDPTFGASGLFGVDAYSTRGDVYNGDLRNSWEFLTGGPSRAGINPSTYQHDYLPYKNPLIPVPGAEQERIAALLPPGHNTYRPGATRHLQNPDDYTPKRFLQYETNITPKHCSRPDAVISNVPLDLGFGTYISETRQQFDRPSAQAYGLSTYELPSGYGIGTKHHIWDWETYHCGEDYNRRKRRDCVTPPQRYNPWPMICKGKPRPLAPGDVFASCR